jgi:hypothetical protein
VNVLAGLLGVNLLVLGTTWALAETTKLSPRLKGPASIELNAKIAPTGPIPAGPAPIIEPGAGYVTVRYAVGQNYDRDDIREVLQFMEQALPAQFGNSSGAYSITLTITDASGKTLVKEPIVSFSWTRERQFLFFDKTISDIQKTSWSGTLVDLMPIKQANQRLKMELQILFQQDRSLDFDLVKKTAKAFSGGALAAMMPLPAAALPIIDSVADLMSALFANSKKKILADEEEIIFRTSNPALRIPVVFKSNEGGQVTVPIVISIEFAQTRLARRLVAGKFEPNAITESMFNATELTIADKTVPLAEIIATTDHRVARNTRTLLDTLLGGGTYGKDPANKKEDDIGRRCGDLYDALHLYLSRFDARAMFWAFLARYGDSMNKPTCLGGRQADLVAVGLTP